MAKSTIEIVGKNSASGAINQVANSLKQMHPVVSAVANSMTVMNSVMAAASKAIAIVDQSVKAWASNERALVAFNAAISQSGSLTAGAARRLGEFSDGMAKMTGATGASVQELVTFLSTSGRTEDQIKKIITVAADMSVATGQTMESSVKNLNKTLGGLTGELGEVIPELKSLNSEQLKSGEAVNLLAEKYKGLSDQLKETSDVSMNNYKNVMTDLQAEMGRSAERNLKPLRDWITSLGTAWVTSMKQMNDYHDAQERRGKGIKKEGDDRTLQEGRQTEIRSQLTTLREALRYEDPASFSKNPQVVALNRELGQIAETLRYIGLAEKANGEAKAATTTKEKEIAEAKARQAELDAKHSALVTENYRKLAAFMEGLQKGDRQAEFFGSSAKEDLSRYLREQFNFSELTRGMATGPEGTKLKEEIAAILIQGVARAGAVANFSLSALPSPGLTPFGMNAAGAIENRDLGGVDLGVPNMGSGKATDILAMMFDSMKRVPGDVVGGAGSILSGAASAVGGAVSNPNQALGGALEGIIGGMSGFLGSLMQGIGAFSSLQAIMNPLATIFGSIMEVIGPVVDELLQPLVGILKIVGKVIGALLVPQLKFLTPIIQMISTAFVWLYNYAIMPLANGIIWVITTIQNGIIDAINGLLNAIDNINIMGWSPSVSYLNRVDPTSMYLQEINEQDLMDAGAPTGDGSGGGGGGSASYQQQRDITVNITINTPALVGEGGFRDFSLMIRREILSAGVLGV